MMDLFNEITVFVNGKKYTVEASKVSPETTLNTYLRDYLHLTGTKRMCLEGGCGACIVSVNRINAVTNQTETFAVNSCLTPIFSCHGWDIYTIEGLGNVSSIHPIQSVLAKFNGTQCGFCSPGMVMNMFALQKSTEDLTMKQVENSFGGNICRCTGYRSILSAFKSMCKDATKDLIEKYPDIEDIKNCEKNCNKKCTLKLNKPFYFNLGKTSWIKVIEFQDLLHVVKSFCSSVTSYMLVAGNTGKGVYKLEEKYGVYIDITNVRELIKHELVSNKLILGANMNLTDTMNVFYKLSQENSKFSYLKKVADHIDLIANVPVRNSGTMAGNLMLKHKYKEFPSDIFLFLETVGAQLQIADTNNHEFVKTLPEFLELDMSGKILKKIIMPPLTNYHYESYKIMPRAQNAHALVNAGFLLKINDKRIVEARIVYGCINSSFIHAKNAEQYLIGRNVFENKTLQGVFEILNTEIVPNFELADPEPDFRKKLAISLFYKFILSIAPDNLVSKRYKSGGEKLQRPVSNGTQEYETHESLYPVSKPIPKIEAKYQTTGEAEYIMDMPDLPNQLYAAFVLAKAPPLSCITQVNASEALKIEGVVAFFDKKDIPGKNTFTPKESTLPMEEELFCSGIVKYHSQPVGIIVAKTHDIAIKAADLVKITYTKGGKPVTSIQDILDRKITGRTYEETVKEAKTRGENIKHTIKGTFGVNWQYHFHMETQCCNVIPQEDSIDMYPSSQWMDLSQSAAAAVLNIPANKINVVVRRLGGAFGAKIVRNSQVSCAAALAAYKLKQPVKLSMPLETNMSAIGKRTPLLSSYDVATDENGVIQHLNNKFYIDYGSGKNEAVLFLAFDTYLATYNTDTWNTSGNIANTDMHASSYIRAPGSVEGLAMCEAIIEHAAVTINMDPLEFRMTNINKNEPTIIKHMKEFKTWADIDERKSKIKQFNSENRWKKKGLSVIPMIFPLSIFYNYGVMVSIYQSDGSVAISHGGIEIGQGINTKVIQVCAYKLGISIEKICVKPSNNMIASNSGPTGASLTSEAICLGVIRACDILLSRMEPVKKSMTNPSWEELVKKCFLEFVNLSATAMYSPKDPGIKDYKVYGVCASEIELDVLTGQHQIRRVDLLEDVGDSMSPEIDIGQIEGAFIMGLGYFTTEQIIVGEDGEILTNRTWNYKPPGAKDIPIDFRIKFIKNNPNPLGVLKTKATGEPPLCLAVSVPLAIRQAVSSAREEAETSAPKWYPFDGPSTVENTFTNCLHNYKHYKL